MLRITRLLPLLMLTLTLSTQGCSCDNPGPGVRGDGGNTDGGDGLDQGSGDASADGSNGPMDQNLPDASPFVSPDVHVLITADNAYGFGYGSASSLVHYFEGVEDGASDIFVCSAACDESTPCANGVACDSFGTCNGDRRGPETYVVPGEMAPQDGYLYVIVWSDESVTQGLIGQFRASDGLSPTVYTGAADWEVCATGMDIDPDDGDDTNPTAETINGQITNCNLGAAGTTFSGGWISEALGNNGDDGMELVVLSDPSMEPPQFANLCQAEDNSDPTRTGDSLDSQARWMWFDDDNTDQFSAFQSNGSPRGDFLIFRLPIEAVIIFG